MIHARFGIPAIALAATIAVASAQAQTQTASREPTVWDHNGSVMYLVANGSSREIYYQKPRPGMLEAGARSGSLLFRGEVNDGQYLGTAYIFNVHCGPVPFEVKGTILNDERIVLTGQAPRVGQNCRTYGSYTSNLEFRRSKLNEAAQTQEPLAAAQLPSIGVTKPEVSSRNDGELASSPTRQHPVKNETPLAAKDSSAGVADPVSTPTAQASVTNETSEAKDLHKYLWGAAFVVMIVWLLIFSIGKILLHL
jgi:hypothetical protein